MDEYGWIMKDDFEVEFDFLLISTMLNLFVNVCNMYVTACFVYCLCF